MWNLDFQVEILELAPYQLAPWTFNVIGWLRSDTQPRRPVQAQGVLVATRRRYAAARSGLPGYSYVYTLYCYAYEDVCRVPKMSSSHPEDSGRLEMYFGLLL